MWVNSENLRSSLDYHAFVVAWCRNTTHWTHRLRSTLWIFTICILLSTSAGFRVCSLTSNRRCWWIRLVRWRNTWRRRFAYCRMKTTRWGSLYHIRVLWRKCLLHNLLLWCFTWWEHHCQILVAAPASQSDWSIAQGILYCRWCPWHD